MERILDPKRHIKLHHDYNIAEAWFRKNRSFADLIRFRNDFRNTYRELVSAPFASYSLTRIKGFENFDDLDQVRILRTSKNSHYNICNLPTDKNYILAYLTLNNYVDEVVDTLRDREETKNA